MRKKSLWICDYPKSSYVSTRNQAMELLERVKYPFIIIIIIIYLFIIIIIIIFSYSAWLWNWLIEKVVSSYTPTQHGDNGGGGGVEGEES